jgi:hypothetical protein
MPRVLPTSPAESPPLVLPPSEPIPSCRTRGMTLGHEVLVALIMAVAMGATVFLYR